MFNKNEGIEFMKKAFTLAEVLITLMIIGIVAALTIPSVISNYQQQEFKTGLKKAVSVLNEAIQTNIAQEGETPYDNIDIFSYLQLHMSVLKRGSAKFCANAQSEQIDSDGNISGCSSAGSITNKIFYTTDGMRFEVSRNDHDGNLKLHESGIDIGNTLMKIRQYGDYGNPGEGHCGSYGLNNNPNNTKGYPCVVVVDVNGDKKPNPKGKFYLGGVRQYDNNGTMVWTSQDASGNTPAYTFPSPSDKKLSDIFTIMITDEKAIPFGVVAQRAMYSK